MANKINFGTDEEFIAKYEELKSSRKMGEFYNCNKTTVLNHAKAIGYNPNSNKTYKLSEQDKQDIIKAYYTEETSTTLAAKYNVSRGMITKIWHDNNLTGKTRSNQSKPKIDLTGLQVNELTVIKPTEERAANGSIKWLCKCSCGNFITVESSRLNKKIAKSCGCLSKKALELGRQKENLLNQTFGALTVIQELPNKNLGDSSLTQWLCRCKCGREIPVLSGNLKSGNSQSCGFCSENSHGNLKIEKILNDNNIFFEREKRFKECKDKTYLPFDFYVDNKYCIEFDGRQHFSSEGTLYNYETTKKHDNIKNQYCKENNIPLIRIPYTHYDDLCLEDLLLETSKFIFN